MPSNLHIWNMLQLKGIFVTGIYMAIVQYCAVLLDIYDEYSSSVAGHACAIWQPYLFKGIWQYGHYSLQSMCMAVLVTNDSIGRINIGIIPLYMH